MKRLFLSYGVALLFCLALLSLLSYGYGAGYVYVYWRDWQLQSNVWAMLFALGLLAFIIQVLWLIVRRYLSREKRKREPVFSFEELHPYEKLYTIWLLEAEQQKPVLLKQLFSQSGFLKHIVEAKILYKQAEYDAALDALKHVPSTAFELAEIQRIEIFIALSDIEQAITHLEFLQQHELSPWLKNIDIAYQQRIEKLWSTVAVLEPWIYLSHNEQHHLDDLSRIQWLEQLLKNFDSATDEQLQRLRQKYLEIEQTIFAKSYAYQMLCLKILNRLPDMSVQRETLALSLLQNHFDQDVFYMWFQQQLLKQNPDYASIEEKVNQFEAQYMSLPMFVFAKWHIYSLTGRLAEAEQLLELYPDNIHLSYLRIKSQLKDREDLIKELNLVFENDANFIQFKI